MQLKNAVTIAYTTMPKDHAMFLSISTILQYNCAYQCSQPKSKKLIASFTYNTEIGSYHLPQIASSGDIRKWQFSSQFLTDNSIALPLKNDIIKVSKRKIKLIKCFSKYSD
mmetsp:Transcript_3955/g.8398  ORF Transcript_3955/g.8398 Transcript_3955/m.8398 type:complete len:111 (+) Transcript_3955:44-376(+)